MVGEVIKAFYSLILRLTTEFMLLKSQLALFSSKPGGLRTPASFYFYYFFAGAAVLSLIATEQ